MTNEELVERFQAGDRAALLELWANVAGLAQQQARRWAGIGGIELQDLMQEGFIATLLAAENHDSTIGTKFSTFLVICLRRQFTEATGQRTQRTKMDPLWSTATSSLDAPATDSEDAATLGELLPDTGAEKDFENVLERDRQDRLRKTVSEALATLPETQRSAVIGKYYLNQPVDVRAHAAAIRALRRPKCSRALRAYF